MNKEMLNKAIKNMRRVRGYKTAMGVILCAGAFSTSASANDDSLTYIEVMGKYLFFEEISINGNMACATCHTGRTGGTGGDSETNLGEVAIRGSNPDLVGTLKPPTNKYVQFMDSMGVPEGVIPFDVAGCQGFPAEVPCGGAFWNGRATGHIIDKHEVFYGLDDKYQRMYEKYLGPLADQAHASPFTNPVEQAHETKKDVCEQVKYKTSWGKELYKYTWGTELKCDDYSVDKEFARFAVSLSAWQMSKDNNRFDSKRDIAIRTDRDGKFPLDYLSEKENFGHDLFYGKARCFFCHQSGNDGGVGKSERYTNDQYFNIGMPRNYEIPGAPEADLGLYGALKDESNPDKYLEHKGKHKVPTLRNVDMRPHPYFAKAYMHNGWLKSLEQVVHFYNSSAVPEDLSECGKPGAPATACSLGKKRCDSYIKTVEEAMAANCWPEPEIKENRPPRFVVGDLQLTPYEEEAIVAYLKTLSDKTSVREPEEYRHSSYDERRLEKRYISKTSPW